MVCNNELASILFDSIHIGVLIVDAESRTILEANPIAELLFGISREELLGQSCETFICNACDMFCNYSGTLDGPLYEKKELELSRRDGTKKYVELYASKRLFNNKYLYILTLVDITDKKEAELQLLKMWEEAKTLLHNNYITLSKEVKIHG